MSRQSLLAQDTHCAIWSSQPKDAKRYHMPKPFDAVNFGNQTPTSTDSQPVSGRYFRSMGHWPPALVVHADRGIARHIVPWGAMDARCSWRPRGHPPPRLLNPVTVNWRTVNCHGVKSYRCTFRPQLDGAPLGAMSMTYPPSEEPTAPGKGRHYA